MSSYQPPYYIMPAIIRLISEISEELKVVEVLSSIDCEIDSIIEKLYCLKQEKKALMQQLLTGKRRVKVTEEVV